MPTANETSADFDPMEFDCENDDWDYLPPDDIGHPFEWKREDWGVYRGRVVAVDYGIGGYVEPHPSRD